MLKLPPIYAEAYHFSKDLFTYTVNIPKAHRPTLGRKIESEALELLILLRIELLNKDRKNFQTISNKVDALKVLLQLAYDLKFFGHHGFTVMIASLEKIGRVLGGLYKYQMEREKDRDRE